MATTTMATAVVYAVTAAAAVEEMLHRRLRCPPWRQTPAADVVAVEAATRRRQTSLTISTTKQLGKNVGMREEKIEERRREVWMKMMMKTRFRRKRRFGGFRHRRCPQRLRRKLRKAAWRESTIAEVAAKDAVVVAVAADRGRRAKRRRRRKSRICGRWWAERNHRT